MPAIPAGPDQFIGTIQSSRRTAKPGTSVNATELTKAIGATWRIVERWIANDPTFPVLTRGSPGNPYRFDLIQVLDYLIYQASAAATAKEARRSETARLAGFGATPGATPAQGGQADAGTAADRANESRSLKALAEAQMITHRLKQQQGEYIRASNVRALLDDLMTTMQTETLSASAKIDPAGQWPAEIRVAVEDSLRTTLVIVRDRLERRITEWGRGGSA